MQLPEEKAGAAQPQLGLCATMPNPGTKGGQDGGRERPFPAPGTLNKPQKSILPLSALQVTRGLIYSPVRILDQVLVFHTHCGSCALGTHQFTQLVTAFQPKAISMSLCPLQGSNNPKAKNTNNPKGLLCTQSLPGRKHRMQRLM